MFVRMIKTSDPECSDGVVRMGRQKEVIQAGQVRSVKCSVRTGPLLSSQEALFVPDEHAPWSEGARMMESMITLGKGTYSRLTLPVINDTGHDITLSPRTVLGQSFSRISQRKHQHLRKMMGWLPPLRPCGHWVLMKNRL
ncbi:hypothetical protein N1851_012550 [Merluccius polli]|uniref:Uncharacterized protein n=1 Tax=Merluccius polli TaxID=89951 RepID=A0AA47MW23_MERPO|nr:hypothetical protein N1851_012550 [Merluccius polli]